MQVTPFENRTIKDKQYFFVNGNAMKSNDDNLLDQFFTKKEVAISLYSKTIDIISKYEENIDDFFG